MRSGGWISEVSEDEVRQTRKQSLKLSQVCLKHSKVQESGWTEFDSIQNVGFVGTTNPRYNNSIDSEGDAQNDIDKWFVQFLLVRLRNKLSLYVSAKDDDRSKWYVISNQQMKIGIKYNLWTNNMSAKGSGSSDFCRFSVSS